MLVVVVMGATVTNTGSAEGCGRSWPLCNGQLIPEFAVKTMIELSHRAVTGIETVLVLALAVGLLMVYRARSEARILAILMVGGLFLQAGMGAWAVLYPQQSLPLAVVLAHRLAAFGLIALLAVLAVLAWRLRADRPDLAWGSLAALGLVLLQSLSGATVVWTGLGLWSALSHAGIMALL